MRTKFSIVLTMLMLLFSAGLSVSAQTDIIVSKQGPYFSIRNAIADAGPGGTVRIRGGRYAATDLQIPYDMTLIGEGVVFITSVRPVAKGLLVPLSGVSLEVRGLIFENATSADKNGAGIRVEGSALIVRDCVFRKNENGILATGSDGGQITISGSRFIDNGYGDGFSHGIYVSSAARLEISGSRFEGSRIGHHVKSVATEATIVRNTTFDDQTGRASYMIDATAGGELLVEGNTMVRAASAEQETLINYDISRGGARGTITIRNNQVVNKKPNAKLLRNAAEAPVYLTNNSFENSEGGTLELPVSTPGLYEAPVTIRYPIVEEKSIAKQADLGNLTPTQRRAVERLIAQGETPRIIEPAEQLARERAGRAVSAPEDSSQTSPIQPMQTRAPVPQVERTKGIMMAPEFPQTERPGDVVSFNLVRSDTQRATSRIVTFGQAFKNGDLQPDDRLAVRTNGLLLPVQMDIKAAHRDGSVRHALLTLDTASLNLRALHRGMLVKSQPVADEAALVPRLDGYNLVVSVMGKSNGDEFAGEANLNSLAAEALALRRYWINGPYATEITVKKDIGAFLNVRADIRFMADNSVRTRLTFENHKTFEPGNRDLSYSVLVRDGRTQVLKRNGISHYRGSNWSEVIWKGRLPAYEVQLDPAYLIDAGAIPPFDLTFGIKSSVIADDTKRLREKTGLFSEGLMSKYLLTTGGRSDIGVLPDWDVRWLKTQDSATQKVMIAMAERAGAVPWHFENDATGEPIRIDQRKKFWSEERGVGEEFAPDNIPAEYFDGGNGGWDLDSAHKPLLSYTAYLATGDAYYARELAHEAAFSIANIWPELRDGKPLVTEAIQVRSRAWGLRDIANAAWLLPDDHPLKSYFKSALESNLSHLYTSYVVEDRMAAAGETKGWFAETVNGEPARISPWQNDYMIMVLAQEALRGAPVAGELISWAANYHTGRFLAQDADPALGAVAVHVAKDPRSRRPVGNWATLMQRTRSYEGATENYPRDGAGYVASAYAALASIYSVTGSPEAADAIRVLAAEQGDDLLFDPDNDEGVYAVSNFLLSVRGPDGKWHSITELLR